MRPQITTHVFRGVPIRFYSVGWLCLFCGITKRSLLNYERMGFPKPLVKIDKTHRYYIAAEVVQYSSFFKSAKKAYGNNLYAKYAITECRQWRKKFAEKFLKVTTEELKKLQHRLNVLRIERDDEILRLLKESEIKKTEEALMRMFDPDLEDENDS